MAQIAIVSFNHRPPGHSTLKYERLGVIGGDALAHYCDRHGYALFHQHTPVLHGLAACWAKIPALLAALQDHLVAVWVDSDAVVANPALRIESFLSGGQELIFQQPERLFSALAGQTALNRSSQPVNTGVFIVRRSAFTLGLLRRAYACAMVQAPGVPWNGIGDQEAITVELAQRPNPWAGVGWVQGLQTLPQDPRHDALFIHFYGDHAEGAMPARLCLQVVDRLGPRVAQCCQDRQKIALLHWCAIQNLEPNAPMRRGGPERFGYSAQELDQALQNFGEQTLDAH